MINDIIVHHMINDIILHHMINDIIPHRMINDIILHHMINDVILHHMILLTTFSPDLANSTAPCIEGNTHCGPNLWKKPITANL